jgi:hypothetical protein
MLRGTWATEDYAAPDSARLGDQHPSIALIACPAQASGLAGSKFEDNGGSALQRAGVDGEINSSTISAATMKFAGYFSDNAERIPLDVVTISVLPLRRMVIEVVELSPSSS